ncbi:unnamed protein product [Ceutorhynchus assimilis]|uniref:Uncharacterized protein n=1 Tax=Ceutorhynchus assimilis TaxID=467358 RepID=A0A9P0GPK6_9CUCU|nr:unnamed protein product [Ceutorhynchus assimilis]
MAMNNNLDKSIKGATNEKLRRIYTGSFTQKKKSFFVKRQDSLNTEGKSNQTDRPNTRRNSNATPETVFPPKSQSSTISKCEEMFKFNQKRRRVVTSSPDINAANLHLNLPISEFDQEESVPVSERSKGGSGSVPVSRRSGEGSGSVPVSRQLEGGSTLSGPEGCYKNVSAGWSNRAQSSEEHEYLMFLLRITEEIISNECYSNADIKRIFQANVELNKNRLNLRKMHIHIYNLCRELNIECEQYFNENNLGDLDASDSPPWNFQTSTKSHHFVMSDLVKNCQDCSVIRKSSLKQNDVYISDDIHMGNIGDGEPSYSDSIQKLLGKLSLGRVTECTEPASSTMSSSHPNHPIVTNVTETQDIDNFETFMEAIDSDRSLPNELLGFGETAEQANKESTSISLINLRESAINQDAQIANSKSCVEFIKNETIDNVPEKQDVESVNKFEKNEVEEIDEDIPATTKSNKISSNSSKIPVLITQSEENLVAELLQSKSTFQIADSKIAQTKSTPVINPDFVKTPTKSTIGTNTDLEKNSTKKTLEMKDFESIPVKHSIGINTNLEKPQTSAALGINTDSEIKSPKSTEIIESSMSKKTSLLSKASNIVNKSEKNVPESPIKITLQGSPNQEDFIMIKGPVYIYKPLLESEPKMIIFENNENSKSRRSSIDSQRSHRTFTVDNSHIFDPVDQEINETLTAKSRESVQTILAVNKTAFLSQNLLNSDYDLTPEKDDCENKYHYLMVDAQTSLSGVNLPESLLLNDEYLVKETSSSEDNYYVNFDSKMLENNYVIHRKLMSSISMPKLMLNSSRLINERGSNSENSGELDKLKKCASDLMTFDVPSQDSSLRSEGEATQNFASGIFWRKF